MDLDFGNAEFDTREIALYRWLHIAPLHQVKAALWSGSWRLLFFDPEPLSEEIVATFRCEQARIAAILAAVTITIRPRPRKGKDDTPPDVLKPTMATARAVIVAKALGASLDYVRWHLPIVQALQVYHHEKWNDHCWTVRPGKEASAEDLEDLTPEDWDDEEEEGKD
jgi:hypothetical protein